MPPEIDWSPLLGKLSPSMDARGSGEPGTYQTTDDDAIKLALMVVQSIFPDYTQKISPKISPNQPSRWRSIAEYYPLGNSISFNPQKMAGQWSPSTSVFVPDDPKKPSRTQINFTTDEVLTNVNTILHELYHARGVGGWAAHGRRDAEKLSGVTPEMKKDVAKMATSDPFGVGNLYSLNGQYLDSEEFLANAVSLLDMKQRGAIPEKGPLTEKLRTVEKIIEKYPQMGAFIENQRQPDIPSLQSGAPEPGTLGSMLEAIFGGPRTEKK